MEARNYIGIVLIAIGTTLIPIGWMFSPITTVVGFLLFAFGVVIFATQKHIEKSEEAACCGYRKHGGAAMPTDIHNHSGWGTGGRSTGWSSSESDGNGGGD